MRKKRVYKKFHEADPRYDRIDIGRFINYVMKEGKRSTAERIVYDAFDPAGVAVSIGNWPGGAAQFGVRGNAPDPKDISVDSGVVKYELLQQDWIDPAIGQRWDRRHFIPNAQYKPVDNVPNAVKGVLLLQMTGPRTLKMETFPGKTAGEVNGFSANALSYER